MEIGARVFTYGLLQAYLEDDLELGGNSLLNDDLVRIESNGSAYVGDRELDRALHGRELRSVLDLGRRIADGRVIVDGHSAYPAQRRSDV